MMLFLSKNSPPLTEPSCLLSYTQKHLPNAGGMHKDKQMRCLYTDVQHRIFFIRNEICGNSNEVSVRTRPLTNRMYNEVRTFRQQALPPTYWAFYMKPLAFITDSEGVEYLFSGNKVFLCLELKRDLAYLHVKKIRIAMFNDQRLKMTRWWLLTISGNYNTQTRKY